MNRLKANPMTSRMPLIRCAPASEAPFALAFDETLRGAMQKETELFFDSIVRENRPLTEILTGDYTFLNERLAQHYGVPGIQGSHFRRVPLAADSPRRGILGQGAVLTVTSHAIRTSPVLRGKYVMEVLLGVSPPAPPANVPPLMENVENQKALSVRERLEVHRKNQVCAACHKMMDPIGLAMENFDVTGRWRVRDNGMPIDSRGDLWDGSKAHDLPTLQSALLKRQETLLRTFTQNLMAYALGRRTEYFDQPTIRAIAKGAAMLGRVKTPPMRQSSR